MEQWSDWDVRQSSPPRCAGGKLGPSKCWLARLGLDERVENGRLEDQSVRVEEVWCVAGRSRDVRPAPSQRLLPGSTLAGRLAGWVGGLAV